MIHLSTVNALLPRRLSVFGEAAVEAAVRFGLAGDATLITRSVHAWDLVTTGWPLALLTHNTSFQTYILAKVERGTIPASDWAEIHAAALLTQSGAAVEFVPRAGPKARRRTPDLRARWGTDRVDVEVTAVVKNHAATIGSLMKALADCLFEPRSNRYYLIHLGVEPTSDMQAQILNAAVELATGEMRTSSDAWQVRVLPLEQRDDIASRLENFDPEWWPDAPTHFVNALHCRVVFNLNAVSYINKVSEKANRFQGEEGTPFLVMVDQSSLPNMPMRNDRWRSELSPWWPSWGRISGVLSFDSRPWFLCDLCYHFSCLPNPDARCPIPSTVIGALQSEVPLCLSPMLPHNPSL